MMCFAKVQNQVLQNVLVMDGVVTIVSMQKTLASYALIHQVSLFITNGKQTGQSQKFIVAETKVSLDTVDVSMKTTIFLIKIQLDIVSTNPDESLQPICDPKMVFYDS